MNSGWADVNLCAVCQYQFEWPKRRRRIKLADFFNVHSEKITTRSASSNPLDCTSYRVDFVGVAFGKNFGVSRLIPKRSCTSKNAI